MIFQRSIFRCLRQYLSGRTLILHRTRKCHLLFGGTDQGDVLKFQKCVVEKRVGPEKKMFKESFVTKKTCWTTTNNSSMCVTGKPESHFVTVVGFSVSQPHWELKDACPLALPGLISRWLYVWTEPRVLTGGCNVLEVWCSICCNVVSVTTLYVCVKFIQHTLVCLGHQFPPPFYGRTWNGNCLQASNRQIQAKLLPSETAGIICGWWQQRGRFRIKPLFCGWLKLIGIWKKHGNPGGNLGKPFGSQCKTCK